MEKEDHPKNPLCGMRGKTRRTFRQQLRYLSVPLKLLDCSEIVFLGDGVKKFPNNFKGLHWKFSVCVCNITYNYWKVSITTNFYTNLSDMCEMKTVVVFVAILEAAGIYIYSVHTEKKAGEQSRNKSKNLCQNEYIGYYLEGECYYWRTIM